MAGKKDAKKTTSRRSSSPTPVAKVMAKKKSKVIENSDDENEEEDDKNNTENVLIKREPTTWKKILTRTIAACVMISLYLGILSAGHLYCILLGFFIQIELYREVVNIRYVEAKERQMPWFRTIQWSWFFAAITTNYGEILYKFFKENEESINKSSTHIFSLTVMEVMKYYWFFFFIMYCVLFMCTVLTLKKNILRFQLSQFMWSIVTICLVVYQVKYFAQISLNGLFWYFFPMATVVMNDVSAYFCGITFGRRFIKSTFLTLSPNKTWEGFIGAAISTLIFSWYFPLLLSRWKWLTCPAETLSFWRPKPLTCQINPVFEMKSYTALPLLGDIEILPIQLHGLLYGLFASLVAPFGGFFASAIKRAYEKKDFDSFIAGHGGLMDRMDCQLLMLAFTAFHYKHFIEITPSLKKMMGIFKLMPETEQLKFLNEIQKILN